MEGLSLLTSGSKLDKLRFLFQVYDVDGRLLEYNIRIGDVSPHPSYACMIENRNVYLNWTE